MTPERFEQQADAVKILEQKVRSTNKQKREQEAVIMGL